MNNKYFLKLLKTDIKSNEQGFIVVSQNSLINANVKKYKPT